MSELAAKWPENSPEVLEDRRRETFDREAIPHLDTLYIQALQMTSSPTDAEDLVQETYLKAFRFFDSFEVGTNCKAWLFRILKNSYINRYRSTKRTPITVDFAEVEEHYYHARGADSSASDLGSEIFKSLLDDEVTVAVERLPEEFRTAVILCDIEGFTYEEIAALVDCPVGTVRSRLHRGRRQLRQELSAYGIRHGYQVPV